MKIICKIFGHKYEKQMLDPVSQLYLMICKRCGHNRDLKKPNKKNIKFKCKYCSFETNNEELFKKHLLIYHLTKSVKPPYDKMTNEEFIKYELEKSKEKRL